MKLVRSTVNAGFRRREQINKLLARLGVIVSIKGFWNRPRMDLELILQDARQAYHAIKVKVHPRRANDSDAAAKDLHSLMQEIEDRFDQKLNPKVALQNLRPQKMKVCPICETKFLGSERLLYCNPDCSKTAINRRSALYYRTKRKK